MSFFDCIQQQSTLSNLFEEYFYLDGVSGKLGFNRYKKISTPSASSTNLQILLEDTAPNFKQCVLTIVKIMSYCTLLIPLIMLTGKAIERNIDHKKSAFEVSSDTPLSPKPLASLSPEVVRDAERVIEKIYNEYYPRAVYQFHPTCPVRGDRFMAIRNDSIPTLVTDIHPDIGEKQLAKSFIKDRDVLFLTDENGDEIDITDSSKVTMYLKEKLTAAFNAGKKVVVARLSNDTHCYGCVA